MRHKIILRLFKCAQIHNICFRYQEMKILRNFLTKKPIRTSALPLEVPEISVAVTQRQPLMQLHFPENSQNDTANE